MIIKFSRSNPKNTLGEMKVVFESNGNSSIRILNNELQYCFQALSSGCSKDNIFTVAKFNNDLACEKAFELICDKLKNNETFIDIDEIIEQVKDVDFRDLQAEYDSGEFNF